MSRFAMPQEPGTFEVSREAVAASVNRRAWIFSGCSAVFVSGFLALMNAINLGPINRHLMETTFVPIALFITVFQAVAILQIWLWDLNRIAWRVRVREDLLHVDAVRHYFTLRWEDIAVIDMNHRKKQELILKTYDGKIFLLGPPIPITDDYVLELKRKATSSIEAADSDAALASARRARLFGAELWRAVRPIAACVLFVVAFYSLYLFMQQNSRPSFVLDNTWNPEVVHLQAGTERPLATFKLTNFGVQTQGIKISLNGNALVAGALKHPKILISAYDRETLAGYVQVALHQHREVVPLKLDEDGNWVGTSKTVLVGHHSSGLAEFVRILRYNFDRSFAHSLEPVMEVEVFADVEPFNGRKELIIEVGALQAATHAGSSAQFEMHDEDFIGPQHLCSATLPARFPVKLYPESSITSLTHRSGIVYSPAPVDEVFNFYKQQLTCQHWTVTSRKKDGVYQSVDGRLLVAHKAHATFTIESQSDPRGVSCFMSLAY